MTSKPMLRPTAQPKQLPSGAWVLRVVIDGERLRLPVASKDADASTVKASHKRILTSWDSVVDEFRQSRSEREIKRKTEARSLANDRKNWAHLRIKGVPVVYAILTGDLVKVGTTTQLDKRLQRYSSYRPEGVDVLAILPGGIDEERALQMQLGAHVARPFEWFYANEDVVTYLRDRMVSVGKWWESAQ